MAFWFRSDLSKPVVGVTGNAKWFSPSWWCICLVLRWCGANPLRISVHHVVALDKLDAIVVSGGDDIHPSLYQEEISADIDYDRERDELEQVHIRYALTHDLPLLGICRGYQLINVTCGGSLYSDITHDRRNTSNKPVLLPLKHAALKVGSILNRCIGQDNIRINSLHHQAIKRVANEFEACAWDQDSFIQGIEHTDNKTIFGVQWHPEYLLYLPAQRRIFKYFVGKAAARRAAIGGKD